MSWSLSEDGRNTMIQYICRQFQEKYDRNLSDDRLLGRIMLEVAEAFLQLTRDPQEFSCYAENCFIRKDVVKFAQEYLAN